MVKNTNVKKKKSSLLALEMLFFQVNQTRSWSHAKAFNKTKNVKYSLITLAKEKSWIQILLLKKVSSRKEKQQCFS